MTGNDIHLADYQEAESKQHQTTSHLFPAPPTTPSHTSNHSCLNWKLTSTSGICWGSHIKNLSYLTTVSKNCSWMMMWPWQLTRLETSCNTVPDYIICCYNACSLISCRLLFQKPYQISLVVTAHFIRNSGILVKLQEDKNSSSDTFC